MLNIPSHRISQYEQFVEDTLNTIHPKTPEEISILFSALSAIYHDKEKLPRVALQSNLADRITHLREVCNNPNTVGVPAEDQLDFKKIALTQVKKKMNELKGLDLEGKNQYIREHLELESDPLTPWISNYTSEEIDGLFALVNLGSIHLNMSESKLDYSGSTNLSFMIEVLQTIVKKQDISSEDKIALKKLIKHYKKTLEIEQLIKQLQGIRDPKALVQAKKNLIDTIYTSLEEEGTVYLPSGYVAEPAGHAVMIKLTLERDVVFAEVINRGEGSNLHGISFKDSQTFASAQLPGVFLNNLKNSKFLSTLLDLQVPEALENPFDPSSGKKTNYSIEEFSHVALSQWPSYEDAYTIRDSLRGSQRGDTCSLKQFISPLRSLVSRETERKIKLHMRMRILELFLHLGTHTEYSIHQIEWAQAEISKSCDSNTALSETDKKEALDLLQKGDDKIVSIKAHLSIEAASKMPNLSEKTNLSEGSLIEVMDHSCGEYLPPPPACTKSPGESLSEIQTEWEALHEKKPFRAKSLRSTAEITPLILNYLNRLPLATDPIWIGDILNNPSLEYHYVGYMRKFIGAFSTRNFCSGDDIALMANAMAGALRKAASENEDQIFILQQASTLLHLLNQSKKQLRIQNPENEKFLEAAIEALKPLYHEEHVLSLQNAPRTVRNWEEKGDLVLTFPTLSFRQIHNTPFLEKVYKEIEAFKKKTGGRPVSESLIERGNNPGFRDRFSYVLDLSEFDSSTERVPLEECTFKYVHYIGGQSYIPTISHTKAVSEHASTFSLGAINELAFVLSGFSRKAGEGNPQTAFFNGWMPGQMGCELIWTTKREPKFLTESAVNGGVLCSHLYPFEEKDELFFIPCLDDRILPASENERIGTCYSSDSQKTLPSIGISRQEQILLKSIGLYDELTIPLWIYYMHEHPERLESPLFGAITEAFLSNRMGSVRNPPEKSWGKWARGLFSAEAPETPPSEQPQEVWGTSVLSSALQDPNSQVAENLLEFLEKELEAIQNITTLDQSKCTLLRTLAIAYGQLSYLNTQDPENSLIIKRLKRAESALLKHLSADTPAIQATIISLYPYIKSNPELVRICRLVISKISYDDAFIKAQSYQFGTDLKEGIQALQSHAFPEDRLPFFIFEEISYLLTDKTPKVHLAGNVYSFMDEDVAVQVIVTSPTSYVLKKQWKDSTGSLKWFSHHKSAESCMRNAPSLFAKEGFFAKQPADYWVHENALESEIVVFPLGTFSSPICRIRNGEVVKGNNPNLSLVPLQEASTKDPLLQRILFFDGAKDILAWKDQTNQVVLIECPNYGFQLQKEKKKASQEFHWKFVHPDFPNTYLDFSRPCMELEPYSHYLPLINAKGGKSIVIPNQIFACKQIGFSGEKDPKGSKSNTPELFRLDLSPQGDLILPLEGKPLLSLFFLAMYIKDYSRAETILKQLALNRAEWTKEESIIISDHLHSIRYPQQFDRSPYACRLRIKLLCLQENLGIPLSTEDSDILLGDYKICKNQQTHGILNDLSSEEELVIDNLLNQIMPKQSIFYPMLSYVPDLPIIRELGSMTFKMLEKMTPSLIEWGLIEADSSSDPQNDQSTTRTFSEGYITSLEKYFEANLDVMKARIDSPLPIPIETRPGKLLSLNFLHYYKVATQGSRKDKGELKKLLELCRYAKFETGEQICYEILLGILHMNESSYFGYTFPPVESMHTSKSLYKLCQDFEAFYKTHKPTPFPRFPQLFCSIPERPLKKTPLPITYPTAERAFLPEDFSLKDSSSAPEKIRSSLIRQEENVQDLERKIAILENKIAAVPFSKEKRKSRRIDELQQQLAVYKGQLEQLTSRKKIAKCRELQELYDFPSEEPSITSSCTTTREGLELFITNLQTSHEKSINSVNAREVNALLDESIRDLSLSVEDKRKTIEAQLHAYPTEQLQFQLKMKLLKTLTLKEALVFFAQQEDQKILESNPGLSGSLSEFKELMVTYLKEKTEMHHLIRLKKLFSEVINASSPKEKAFAYRKFLEGLNAPRAYDINTPDFQALLVFEELNDLRLRTEQVKALIDMTAEDSNNIELEARTGFGKSQVLIPLWLLLKSKSPETLTMMVVPASLLADQEKHLQRLLGRTLSKAIHKITFSREKASDLGALEKLHADLIEARKEKRVILTNIGSLHGMISLALKEALSKECKNPSPNGRALVEKLKEIRKFIKSEASIFIDESRECLTPRQRFDYARGSPILISPELCQDMSLFWEKYFFDPFIQSRWNFEFLPQGAGKELTEDNFEELKRDLAETVTTDLFPDASEDLKQDCISHLTGEEASIDLKNAIEQLSPEKQKQYALCHSQISIHLKKTLLNKCGERYDLNSELIAFPFKAGTPQPTSEFATLDDLLNFSFQANLKRDIKEDVVHSYIETLRRDSLKEAGFDTKPTYILFQKIQEELGLGDLDQLHPSDIKKITTLLNKGLREFKLPFIALWVIPHITFVPGKISGTSFNLFLHIDKVHMASGTTDPDALHPRMKASANPAAPIGNLLSIYEHSAVQIIPEDPKEALVSLLKDPFYTENSPPIIIDVGGKFLDLSEETILSLFFANNPHIEGVSYYDEDGKHLLRMRNSTTSIPRELASLDIHKIGIFIKEGNAIGSDTPMPITAKGKVTANHVTTESFFLQGAGRMRGLSQGQTLDIAISKKDLNVITPKPNLTVPDLLKHLKIQEGRQKGLDYFFSLKLYLETLIEEPLWETEDTDELLHRFSLMEDLIVSSTLTDPVKTLYQTKKMLTAQEAVRLLKESLLKPLKEKNLPFIDITRIEDSFDAQVKYHKLLSMLPGGENEIQESITEAEQETTQEITQENIVDNTREKETITFKALPIIPWNGDYAAAFAKEPSEELCNTSLYLSPNFSHLSKFPSTPLHKASYLCLLQIDPTGKKKVMALDLHDAHQALSYMKKQPKKKQGQAKTYLISHQGILTSDDATAFSRVAELFTPSKKTEISEITLLNKILTGTPVLNKDEVNFLKKQDAQTLESLLEFTNIYKKFWPELERLSFYISQLLN